MRLADVARAVGAACPPEAASWVLSGVSTDSRRIDPGDLFIGIKGPNFDGSDYAERALAAGAVACLVSSASARRRLQSPGRVRGRACTPAAVLAVDDTLRALGKLSAYYRRVVMDGDTVVIAVTGSNGKTTTKRMIDDVLPPDLTGRASPANLNNAVGVPLTLLSAQRGDRYLVVEIGTKAPGEVAALAELASPDIAVITSIGVAHAAGLGSLAAIAAEKASLLRYVRTGVSGGPGGFAVINADQPELLDHVPDDYACERWGAGIRNCGAGDLPARVCGVGDLPAWSYGAGDLPAWVCGAGDSPARGGTARRTKRSKEPIRARDHGDLMDDASARLLVTVGHGRAAEMRITELEAGLGGTRFVLDGVIAMSLPLPGAHHAVNAAAAYVVGRRMGIVADDIIERLAKFAPPEGRTCVIRTQGITIIDDCYNANPSSMRAAVELLRGVADRRRVLVFGDMLELGDQCDDWHRRLGEAAADAGLEVLVTVGSHADMAAAAARAGGLPWVQHTASASEAAEVVEDIVREGDVVLVKGSRGVRLEGVVERLRSRRREAQKSAAATA